MAPEGDVRSSAATLPLHVHARRPKGHLRKTGFRERLQQFDLLLSISRRLSGMEALDEILDAVVELTSQAIGCDRSTFFLHDSSSNELFSRTAQGMLREIRLPSAGGVAGAVFRSGEPLIVRDAYTDTRFNTDVDQLTGYKTKNLLCVPLRSINDEVIGGAQCLNKNRGDFNDQDLRLLVEI